MISIEDARHIILKDIVALPSGDVPLMQGLGVVTCEDIYSPIDIPLSDNSAMDGYAYSHAALSGIHLRVTGFLPAGKDQTAPVAAGEAVKIMTGAMIPPGCDTVVPFEDVEEFEGGIRLAGSVKPGSHIRRRGEDIKANSLVMTSGSIIRPQEIGLLVSMGMNSVKVYRKARVAILATGDELLEAGESFAPNRIFNSNSYSLAAQVLEAGGEPVLLGIAPDVKDATIAKIREGLQADILITTGGVSVGDRDFVKESIQDLGGEILFWKVNMKPGKPVAFALLDNRPVFALPGNPAAAMVAFEMFVRPAILKLMGHARIFRPVIKAVVIKPVQNRGDRPHLVRCLVVLHKGKYVVSTAENQSSANILSLTSSNGLMELAPGATLAPGDEVAVTLLDREFEMGEITCGAG